MFFDTPLYFVFLALVAGIYWRLAWRRQNVLLLAASYFFYGWWDWRFLSLILISTIVDYFCAIQIAQSQDHLRRKLLLTLSVALNVSFLGFFKYCDFFTQSLHDVLVLLGIPVSIHVLGIILPPGISFYTFQELAYIVDVYYGKLKPARSFVDYALFISLFPHLIAGPIQRPSHLLPQVQQPRRFESSHFFDGIMLLLSGLFRKAVIADNCALLANAAFSGQLGEPSLAVVLLGAYAFAWQIYGDFSGYSDMARGSAQLLGFHFMVNFRQPYLSTSLQDFWRRWHISLSSWLRDYLYIPLGGNRYGERRTYGNLMTTMLLGGLWHGANWTFIIWGGLHGAWLAFERFVRQLFPALQGAQSDSNSSLLAPRGWIRRILIFHLVCLTWIFFRAPSVTEALEFLRGAARWSWRPEYGTAFVVLGAFTIPLFLLDLLLEARDEEYVFAGLSVAPRFATAVCLATVVAFFAANQVSAFIYFQF